MLGDNHIYTPECPNNRNQVLSHVGKCSKRESDLATIPACYEYGHACMMRSLSAVHNDYKL